MITLRLSRSLGPVSGVIVTVTLSPEWTPEPGGEQGPGGCCGHQTVTSANTPQHHRLGEHLKILMRIVTLIMN